MSELLLNGRYERRYFFEVGVEENEEVVDLKGRRRRY